MRPTKLLRPSRTILYLRRACNEEEVLRRSFGEVIALTKACRPGDQHLQDNA